MYNFEKLGRKSVIRGVEKYHWIILLKKTNVHTKTLNEIIRSTSQHPIHRTAQPLYEHRYVWCSVIWNLLLLSLKAKIKASSSNLKFIEVICRNGIVKVFWTIICVKFICCYVWSEYHVLFRVQCCPARSLSSHASIKQPSAKWTTRYRHNSKWWTEYLPVKLSVGILPLPLPRRVEIEARGVGYWIFRGSSGHFDHSTILTSTIPATELSYLRLGAPGMENIHK